MVTFVFTKQAEKRLKKIAKPIQERIIKKLEELKAHGDILSILKPLHNFEPATHRLRVGNYRLILELKVMTKTSLEFWILDVGDRKEVYR